MAGQKSSGTTFILNFLIPGTGHLYASGGERWGPLAINIVCAVLGAVIVFPWIGNLIIWIYTMVTSGSITQEYNELHMDYEEDLSWKREQERERGRVERAKREQREAQQRIEKAERERIDEARVNGAELASKMAKVQTLVSAGVLDAAEGEAERAKIIAGCLNGWTGEDKLTFLGPFAELLNQGTLAATDLQAVKNLYSALSKKRPDPTSLP
jgi:hypothetical protein